MAAVALLAGFYVVAAALVAVFVWLALVSAVGWTVLTLVLAALVVLVVVRVSRLPALVVSGPSFPVNAAAQPELWAQVREVAGFVGARPPSKIVLVPVADATVTEDAALLGLVGGKRTLLFGIPLLAGLSAEQFRAVLAQEFARDGVVRRGLDQLTRVVVALRRNRLLSGFFAWLATVYGHLAESPMRRLDFHADAEAARLTSPATVIAALNERLAIAEAWPAYAAEHGAKELPPLEFAQALRAFIDARSPVPAGDHARIAALEKLPAASQDTDERPAFVFFQGDALN